MGCRFNNHCTSDGIFLFKIADWTIGSPCAAAHSRRIADGQEARPSILLGRVRSFWAGVTSRSKYVQEETMVKDHLFDRQRLLKGMVAVLAAETSQEGI